MINSALIAETNFRGIHMTNNDEDVLKYIKRSSYRVKVLKTLKDDPKIPRDVAADSGILQNHISNVLKQLSDLDLVVCVNPSAKKGRIYRLSEHGEEISDKL